MTLLALALESDAALGPLVWLALIAGGWCSVSVLVALVVGPMLRRNAHRYPPTDGDPPCPSS